MKFKNYDIYKAKSFPKLICGFPCIGKALLCKSGRYNYRVDALESHYYYYHTGDDFKMHPSGDFPHNYIKDIKIYLEKPKLDHIFVSSHKHLILELLNQTIPFGLIYPVESALCEYIGRVYVLKKEVNETYDFTIEKLYNEWDDWLSTLNHFTITYEIPTIVLDSNEYLSYAMTYI